MCGRNDFWYLNYLTSHSYLGLNVARTLILEMRQFRLTGDKQIAEELPVSKIYAVST
jgi:hypothetical protein